MFETVDCMTALQANTAYIYSWSSSMYQQLYDAPKQLSFFTAVELQKTLLTYSLSSVQVINWNVVEERNSIARIVQGEELPDTNADQSQERRRTLC